MMGARCGFCGSAQHTGAECPTAAELGGPGEDDDEEPLYDDDEDD